MKILIAGASGAIGLPLITLLVKNNHDVYGITHSEENAKTLSEAGTRPIFLNVLDKKEVQSSVADIRPNVIIDMLTSLPKEYTPKAMQQAAEMDAKIRISGGQNLLDAAKAQGAKRYIAQSAAFWYEPGQGLADEAVPFAFNATPGIAAGSQIYRQIEKRTLESGIEGVALRFGFFYGHGTWFTPGGNVAAQIQKREFPLIGSGNGYWNFIHIDDAAKAIELALTSPPGVYNIVNDHPSMMKEWLPQFAKQLHAPDPLHLSEEEGIKQFGQDRVYYATKLRAASNAKAKKVLGFAPRKFDLST